MKIGDLIAVYIPTDKAIGSQVLEAALPTHLTRARTVANETVPELTSEEGKALLVRIEDIIEFRAKLVPVREAKSAAPEVAEPEPLADSDTTR